MGSNCLDARIKQGEGFERDIVAGDSGSSSTGCPKAGVEPRLPRSRGIVVPPPYDAQDHVWGGTCTKTL
jgi:hypothetical protein